MSEFNQDEYLDRMQEELLNPANAHPAYKVAVEWRDKYLAAEKEIERLRADAADDRNWRPAVTHALQPNLPWPVSRGRALELIAELKHGRCRVFRVERDGQLGTCYSFHTHFDIWWDDGGSDQNVADLSCIGVRKTSKREVAGGGE